jgi:alpha-amylase/alpha-mannosidase (GH57 family)
MSVSVVVHGHFYQPPREDPWTGRVPREPSAAPFHDWNQRIADECYRPFAAARVLDDEGDDAGRVNLYAHCSFNVGATLAWWLDRFAPDVLASMVAGDHASCQRLGGHGNAIAQPFHHIILPLASRRDKVAEVRWGIADFQQRFGRAPEGMWLPETAVDEETLVVLAEEGIRFTILAPHQVEGAPADGSVGVWDAGGGRSIALCSYDGALASQIAFGDLLRDGDRLAAQLVSTPDRLRAVATDGETFGHHHTFGEMALARALMTMAARPDVQVTNYAAYLATHPATAPVSLVAPSSWSCTHGIERWRSDCGCALDPQTWPEQAWRAPLREALDWLANALRGPGAAYDEALERAINRMFTSCAWFFDDITRLEVAIVLRYARWAMERAGRVEELEAPFLARLTLAVSGAPSGGDAATAYHHAIAERLL